MKKYKIASFLLAAFTLLFVACSPVVDEEELKNNTTADAVELVASQSTAGGNQITLHMRTPGVNGHWDTNFGKAYTDRTTFNYPLTGTYEFTYYGSLGAEYFEKSISVTIDMIDNPVDPEWALLMGDDPATGKNWEYDKSQWTWWYMSPPDDPSAWNVAWWNADACCAPSDNAGQMRFYYDGGVKYDHFETVGATPTTGSFSLNIADATDISITEGQNILGGYGDRGKANATYRIISLTETELILYADRTIAGDSGWTYYFKAVE